MADEILNVEQQNEAPHNITIYKGDNIRDKELIEAESATTAQSGDSVVLKTTAGTYVEIDRDSFAEVIREQLGRLIKGTTDKGTTINGIAAMDASNDLGWVSAANLASVLGDIPNFVFRYLFTSYRGSVNDLYKGGIYLTAGHISDLPNNANGVVVVFGDVYGNYTGQLFFDVEYDHFHLRNHSGSLWPSWRQRY